MTGMLRPQSAEMKIPQDKLIPSMHRGAKGSMMAANQAFLLILLPLLGAAAPTTALSQTQNENAAINGEYTFYLTGQGASSSGLATAPVGIVGSFTADGQGHITAGVLDENSLAGLVLDQKVTGTYQFDSIGKGLVTLQTSAGTAGFTFYSPLPLNASSQNFTVVAGAGTLQSASGRLTASFAIPPYLNGSGVISTNLMTQAAPGEVMDFGSAIFSFTPVSSGQLSAQGQETVHGSTPQPFSSASGTYTSPDPVTGRFTISLEGLGVGQQAAHHYVAYQAGSQTSQFFFLSIDPVPASPLVIGTPVM